MAELAWTLEDGREQSLTFDATVREAPESTATITEHPIEEGADISDHVRKDLDRISLQVVVSDTPIVNPADHNDGSQGSIQSVQLSGQEGELTRAQVLVFDGGVTRVRSVYEELLDLMGNGTRVRVMTRLRELEDMVVKRVSPIREADSGDSLVATLELQQISVVSSEIVAAPEPRETRGNNAQERGRENTEDEGEGGQSLLAAGLDGLTSFFGGS